MSHTSLPTSIAALLAVAITVIGGFYVVAPERVMRSFGLPLPSADADTRAWLRLKGIRDVASGLLVLTLMATTNTRTVGIALLALTITPLGDMSNVLGSRGSKLSAFSVHGATCAVMLAIGFALVRVP